MEFDPNDYDVVKLLTTLKNDNESYPPDLLTPRRQNYLRRVAEIGPGIGIAAGLKSSVEGNGKTGGLSSTSAGGLIEAALVVAIVAEAGTAAYIHRDRIAEIFQSNMSQPRVELVTSAPETEFSPKLPIVVDEDPVEITATSMITETPSATPVPDTIANNTPDSPNALEIQDVQVNSTPLPNGNNGNHFGQTPKPDRTRDPGDNDDDGKDKDKGRDSENDNDDGRDKDKNQ